jgi:hypothetical protein
VDADAPHLDLLSSPCDAGTLADVPPPSTALAGLDALARQLAAALGPGSPSPSVAVRWLGTGGGVRYPMLAGIPVLTLDHAHDADGPLGASTGIPPAELDHYTAASLGEVAGAAHSPVLRYLRRLRDAEATAPEPGDRVGQDRAEQDRVERYWIDAPYDGPAQLRCYQFLRPVLAGGVAAQVGGVGTHALKFLLAGAARAVAVSPVVGELVLTMVYARLLGVADRLVPVAGTGEALPLATGVVDGLYCGGTLHHMNTTLAGREFARVLGARGRFAAAEPWKVPVLHVAGTRLLGKREAVDCRPIDQRRLAALRQGFDGRVDQRRHGALTRYPALALGKAGVRPATHTLLRVMLREDALGLPGGALGSSLSLTGAAPDQ